MALRNTFALPLWLRNFQEAKVDDIDWREADVAQSLRMRSRKWFVNTTRRYRTDHPIVSLRP